MRVNEQGRSMIEMLGVLAIVGVLSVGGIAGYSKAMNKFKANKFIDQVNQVSTNVRTMFASQRSYASLNNSTAADLGILPTDMYDAKTTPGSMAGVTNAFGGNFIVKSAKTLGGEAGAFIIAADGIPAAACLAVVTTDWGGDAGSGLVAMKVNHATTGTASSEFSALNSTEVSAVAAAASNITAVPGSTTAAIPLTLVQAQQVCGKTGNSAIAWKFL